LQGLREDIYKKEKRDLETRIKEHYKYKKRRNIKSAAAHVWK
jgi:hypothetical protein